MPFSNTPRTGTGARRQRGIAVVEFTILLPVMLLLLMAIGELGRAFMQYNTLTRAVRDSARYVASHALKGSTQVVTLDGALIDAATNLVIYGKTTAGGTPLLQNFSSGGSVQVQQHDPAVPGGPGEGNITVTATYPFTPTLGAVMPDVLGDGGISTAFTMRAQVTMMAL
jgi:Flp pilus assembly protein TadG